MGSDISAQAPFPTLNVARTKPNAHISIPRTVCLLVPSTVYLDLSYTVGDIQYGIPRYWVSLIVGSWVALPTAFYNSHRKGCSCWVHSFSTNYGKSTDMRTTRWTRRNRRITAYSGGLAYSGTSTATGRTLGWNTVGIVLRIDRHLRSHFYPIWPPLDMVVGRHCRI
jgi:hypothetical protein